MFALLDNIKTGVDNLQVMQRIAHRKERFLNKQRKKVSGDVFLKFPVTFSSLRHEAHGFHTTISLKVTTRQN